MITARWIIESSRGTLSVTPRMTEEELKHTATKCVWRIIQQVEGTELKTECTMTLEGKLKTEVKKELDSFGPDLWYFCPMMNGYGKAGVPDFVGCYKGKFFAIETKAKDRRPTPWQGRCIEQIGDAWGHVLVCYSHVEVERFIKELVR